MRVQDVMTTKVQTASAATGADEAWNVMKVKGIHHLVITDGAQIVGVLSDRDVGGRQGAPLRKNRDVGELMTRRVVTVEPTTTVRRAANLMRGHSIGCLVVADGNRVRGIVTVADLLELIGRGEEKSVTPAPRRTLHHRAPHRKRHSSTGVW